MRDDLLGLGLDHEAISAGLEPVALHPTRVGVYQPVVGDAASRVALSPHVTVLAQSRRRQDLDGEKRRAFRPTLPDASG
jgi:hypothetical protein